MLKVYTTTTCAYCKMVKKFLTNKGKDFEEVNLDDNPTLRQELYEKTGQMTVPITSDGTRYVVGWNPMELSSL